MQQRRLAALRVPHHHDLAALQVPLHGAGPPRPLRRFTGPAPAWPRPRPRRHQPGAERSRRWAGLSRHGRGPGSRPPRPHRPSGRPLGAAAACHRPRDAACGEGGGSRCPPHRGPCPGFDPSPALRSPPRRCPFPRGLQLRRCPGNGSCSRRNSAEARTAGILGSLAGVQRIPYRRCPRPSDISGGREEASAAAA